jgi:hypothetical protein
MITDAVEQSMSQFVLLNLKFPIGSFQVYGHMKFAIHTFIQGLLSLFIGSKYVRMITQYIQHTQKKNQAYIHTSGSIQYRNSHYRICIGKAMVNKCRGYFFAKVTLQKKLN